MSAARRGRSSDEEEEEEEGEVDDDDSEAAKKSDDREAEWQTKADDGQVSTVSTTARRDSGTVMTRHLAVGAFQVDEPSLAERCSLLRNELSLAERRSLLRNDLRAAIRPFRGNKLFLRFATQGD